MQIIKRDGRTVPFNTQKIASAIFKAAFTVGGSDLEQAEVLAEKVKALTEAKYSDTFPTVENVQDLVEKVLVDDGHTKTAKAYILFRHERTRAREMNSSLMHTLEELTFARSADSDTKRENANINTDTAMGTMLKYGSESSKAFTCLYVLDPAQAKAHAEGAMHVHDLDFYTLTETCCQIGLQRLLHDGFFTGHGFLRTPNSIGSAASLTCIAIQSNQNDQHRLRRLCATI